MSVSLVFDLDDVERAARRIDDLSDLDTGPLLDALGAEATYQFQRRIKDEKTSPDGTPWESLNSDYEAWKKEKSSGGILEFSGHLEDSIQHLVQGDQVLVGSNLVYAAHHNFGGEEIGTGMPQREYLGFSDENEQDLQAVVDDFLRDKLNELQHGFI